MSYPSILFLHAHPDDEAIWTGGTIARAVARGGRVRVVTCTWTPGTVRYDELAASLATLGAGAPHPLGFADQGFTESAPGNPRFCDASFDEPVKGVVAEIREFQPDAVITYDAYGVYGHPDHIHAHRVALAAVEAAAMAAYQPEAGPAWQVKSTYLVTPPRSLSAETWRRVVGSEPPNHDLLPGTDDNALDLVIAVGDLFEVKWNAMMAHASEVARSKTLSMLMGFDDAQRRQFLDRECYVRRDIVPGGVDLT